MSNYKLTNIGFMFNIKTVVHESDVLDSLKWAKLIQKFLTVNSNLSIILLHIPISR